MVIDTTTTTTTTTTAATTNNNNNDNNDDNSNTYCNNNNNKDLVRPRHRVGLAVDAQAADSCRAAQSWAGIVIISNVIINNINIH